MKKESLLITILSFIVISFLIYINVYKKDVIIKNFKANERIEVFSTYKDQTTYFCYGNKLSCKKIKYKTTGKVDTKKVGVYNVIYTATYKNKMLKKKKKVEIKDRVRPELTIEGVFNNVCPNGKTDKIILKAVDNYDGDITSKIEYKIGNNKILYKVEDSSGNITLKEVSATFMDDEKPSIILNGTDHMYLVVGSKYEEPGYTAFDNCDGNITENVTISGTVNTNKEGTYVVKYMVKDETGNETVIIRTIKVFKKNNYSTVIPAGKTIYLTFDDGPGPYTDRLLDILAKYNVKATFFIIGTRGAYDNIIVRAHSEGHTIGLHSYNHLYSNYVSETTFLNDLIQLSEKVKNLIGVESKIIRFPGGSSNVISRRYSVGIMSQLTKKVEELGYVYFDWNISSGDAGNTTNTNQIIRNVTSELSNKPTYVVLQHDIKSYSVDAVEEIIKYGLANGYSFAPLTTSSPVIHHTVNN